MINLSTFPEISLMARDVRCHATYKKWEIQEILGIVRRGNILM